MLRNISHHFFGLFFTFETSFVFFLYAPRIKADVRFSWIPVDLTILFFSLNVLLGIWLILRKKIKIVPTNQNLMIAVGAFIIYSCASLLWSVGYDYATTKAIYISTLLFWCVIATSLIVSNNSIRIRRFLIILLLFSIWFTIESIIAYFLSSRYVSISTIGGNYLGTGRVIGLGIVISWGWLTLYDTTSFQKLILMVILLIGLFAILVLGGRAPLICLILSVVFLFGISTIKSLLREKLSLWLLSIAIFILVAAIGGYTYATSIGLEFITLERLSRVGTLGSDGLVGPRESLYVAATSMWQSRPFFGYGIGSFPIYLGVGDIRYYPHNMILEILSELGLVGLLLYAFILTLAIKHVLQSRLSDPLHVLTIGLLVNLVLNAMFSGDLNDNRAIFAFIGLTSYLSTNYHISGAKQSAQTVWA